MISLWNVLQSYTKHFVFNLMIRFQIVEEALEEELAERRAKKKKQEEEDAAKKAAENAATEEARKAAVEIAAQVMAEDNQVFKDELMLLHDPRCEPKVSGIERFLANNAV
jgi:hypothetical protein